MIKSRSEVQTMIMKHIRDIDMELNNINTSKETKVELAKAKSTALVALAQIATS